MLKILKQRLLPIFGAWAVLRFFLDNWGRFQELREFFTNRGTLMKWIGIVVTSQWLPIALFVVAVGVLAMIHFDLSPSKKKKEQAAASTVQPASSIQPMMPTIPAQDLSYLADPAYDYLWRDSTKLTFPASNKTLIELIDDALADGERVATFCEGFHPGSECQQQANTWIEKTRNVLRERAPNYIAMFNETVKNPFPNPWLPVSGRRVEETAKWFGDQERREAWRVVAATVEQLPTIRSKIRATLPS